MARRIVFLNAVANGAEEQPAQRVVLWADVSTNHQRFYANANATSAFLDATAQEITDLKNGAIVERVITVYAPVGGTNNDLQAAALGALQDFQREINKLPNRRYGTSYDPALAPASRWTITNIT